MKKFDSHGGTQESKQLAAAIARPSIIYPHQTSDFSNALEFCHQHIV